MQWGRRLATVLVYNVTMNTDIEKREDNLPATYEEAVALITDPLKKAYIEGIAKLGYHNVVCGAVGVPIRTPYDWRERDIKLSHSFALAKKRYEANLLDRLELILEERCADPKMPQSTIALIFALKAANPMKYSDKAMSMVQVDHNITFKCDIPRPYE